MESSDILNEVETIIKAFNTSCYKKIYTTLIEKWGIKVCENVKIVVEFPQRATMESNVVFIFFDEYMHILFCKQDIKDRRVFHATISPTDEEIFFDKQMRFVMC